jgi:hypothetical protein
VRYWGLLEGVVTDVARITADLSAGVVERIVVTVEANAPLELGDELVANGTSLGTLVDIVDDGASSPQLYARRGNPTCDVTFGTKARDVLELRGIGAYDTTIDVPLTGEVVRDDQLAWLAAAGATAVFSELGVYKTGEPLYKTRVYEDMAKLGPIADGWSLATPAATSASTPKPNAPAFANAAMPLDLGFLAATPAPEPPPQPSTPTRPRASSASSASRCSHAPPVSRSSPTAMRCASRSRIRATSSGRAAWSATICSRSRCSVLSRTTRARAASTRA